MRHDFELEYYQPTHDNRQIQSIFSNALFGAQILKKVLVVEFGFTWTNAWGSIIQDGTRLETAVLGAGPIFLIRCEPFHIRWFSISLDILGGIVVYTDKFPPGGDVYNFTWRLGGALLFRLTDQLTLTVGARWMHVSNGQGLNKGNPSYEGVGVPIGLTYRL